MNGRILSSDRPVRVLIVICLIGWLAECSPHLLLEASSLSVYLQRSTVLDPSVDQSHYYLL